MHSQRKPIMKSKFFFEGTLEVPSMDPLLVEKKPRVIPPEEYDRVICQHSQLVFRIALRLERRGFATHWGQVEDLFQEGMIALMKAVKAYNPFREDGTYKGAKFTSYACACIYRHLNRMVLEGGLIATPSNSHEANEDELNEKFNKAVALAYKKAQDVKSLSSKKSDKDELATFLEAPQEPDQLEYEENIQKLREALDKLHTRHKEVLSRRFGLDREEETLLVIGEFLGVSKERARQLESAALNKLKNWLLEGIDEVNGDVKSRGRVSRSKIFDPVSRVPHPIDRTAKNVAPEPQEEMTEREGRG